MSESATATPATQGPAPLDLLRGVTYLGHSEADGVTLCVLHEGLTHQLHAKSIRIHGDLAEGRRVAILQINSQLRVTVLP